jgi:hypothetical protein
MAAKLADIALSLIELIRAGLNAVERFALRQYVMTRGVTWFGGLQQKITSAATNSVDAEPATYSGPTVYMDKHDLPLPYPAIADDTESISGFVDLVKMGLVKKGELVVNLGGGAFDGGPRWLAQQVPGVTVLTADPFRRPAAHNAAVQAQVEEAGGADVVASISVLNVIKEPANRVAHAALAHKVLKRGGLAYFKVWADCWPDRGLGVGATDGARATHQTQRWANAYLPELEAAFGAGQVFADCTANLLVAKKA